MVFDAHAGHSRSSRGRRFLGCKHIGRRPQQLRQSRSGPLAFRARSERTKTAIAERQKFSELLKMLRAGLM
jgi:hypothetical protein